MASLQVITETILQEAKESASLIIQEAQKLAETMVEAQRQLALQSANEVIPSILKKAEIEGEINNLRSVANAKIEANWLVLSEKERWITAVLNEAKNKLKTLTRSKEYLQILEKPIAEAGVILGGKELEILLNERDSTLPLKLDRLAREISEKTGAKTKLALSREKPKVIGGAIVRTIDGRVVMDNTFDDMLKRREKDLRYKIAKILFK